LRYLSTRGGAPAVHFDDAILAGLAPDGGLYWPEHWPHLDIDDSWSALGYADVAARVIAPFTHGVIDPDTVARLAGEAYAGFRSPEVAPLTKLEDGWLLELFWGPTLSFKDYALQMVGRLLDHVLSERGEELTIIGATSGDTGSAAIEALRGAASMRVVVLHPEGRVSEVQRRQMSTVLDDNVRNVAIAGTFDDCQDIVKALLTDTTLPIPVSAVNSINFARIASQAAYYVWASLRVGGEIAVAVPSGNFGNALSAYVARSMGVPISHIVVGTNVNRGLSDFLQSGRLEMREVVPTIAPAMDIQIPSNLERLLFDMVERDPIALRGLMEEYRASGVLQVPAATIGMFQGLFSSAWMTDDAASAAIADLHSRGGPIVDPHTAIGWAAGITRHRNPAAPLVVVSTAHPAKFPDAVEAAVGERPALPDDLADLMTRDERVDHLPPSEDAVRAYLLDLD
jgi:threonine synthase